MTLITDFEFFSSSSNFQRWLSSNCLNRHNSHILYEFPEDPRLMLTENFKGRACRQWNSKGACQNIDGAIGRSLWLKLASTFVPEGRVTNDYLTYQVWDSVQGLCSYIRGMLSSRAMLEGIGVGNTNATAQSAVFTVFMRDMSGTLGGVLFAAANGSGLDAYAKQWRFFADCLNNVGYFLELFSPMFPSLFLPLACLGSLARAVTGVAAGATKASLTQHFAIDGNAADVSAKEGSQESLVTLIGMLLGMLVVHLSAGSALAVWTVFLTLTALHVYSNYRAMRCLELSTVNRPRLNLIAEEYLRGKGVPTIAWVAQQESILPDFLYRPYLSSLGFDFQNSFLQINMGKPFHELERSSQEAILQSKSEWKHACFLRTDTSPVVDVLLNSACTNKDFICAYLQAFCTAKKGIGKSKDSAEQAASKILELMPDQGWIVERACLGLMPWRIDRDKHGHEE